MSAGVFFQEFFDEFKTKLLTRASDCAVFFGRKNKPRFTRNRNIVISPLSSAISVPEHCGNFPLQLYFIVLTFEMAVNSRSFEDMTRLKQLAISMAHDTRDEEPFLNCTFKATSETYDEQAETDAYETCLVTCEFGHPLFYGADDMPNIGVPTSIGIESITL